MCLSTKWFKPWHSSFPWNNFSSLWPLACQTCSQRGSCFPLLLSGKLLLYKVGFLKGRKEVLKLKEADEGGEGGHNWSGRNDLIALPSQKDVKPFSGQKDSALCTLNPLCCFVLSSVCCVCCASATFDICLPCSSCRLPRRVSGISAGCLLACVCMCVCLGFSFSCWLIFLTCRKLKGSGFFFNVFPPPCLLNSFFGRTLVISGADPSVESEARSRFVL